MSGIRIPQDADLPGYVERPRCLTLVALGRTPRQRAVGVSPRAGGSQINHRTQRQSFDAACKAHDCRLSVILPTLVATARRTRSG